MSLNISFICYNCLTLSSRVVFKEPSTRSMHSSMLLFYIIEGDSFYIIYFIIKIPFCRRCAEILWLYILCMQIGNLKSMDCNIQAGKNRLYYIYLDPCVLTFILDFYWVRVNFKDCPIFPATTGSVSLLTVYYLMMYA